MDNRIGPNRSLSPEIPTGENGRQLQGGGSETDVPPTPRRPQGVLAGLPTNAPSDIAAGRLASRNRTGQVEMRQATLLGRVTANTPMVPPYTPIQTHTEIATGMAPHAQVEQGETHTTVMSASSGLDPAGSSRTAHNSPGSRVARSGQPEGTWAEFSELRQPIDALRPPPYDELSAPAGRGSQPVTPEHFARATFYIARQGLSPEQVANMFNITNNADRSALCAYYNVLVGSRTADDAIRHHRISNPDRAEVLRGVQDEADDFLNRRWEDAAPPPYKP